MMRETSLVLCVIASPRPVAHIIRARFPSQHGYGWNAANGKYCDLMDAGVVDPAKVTINAVENSASVAGLVLTTECLVTEIPVFVSDEDMQRQFDAEGMGAGMGMQGM